MILRVGDGWWVWVGNCSVLFEKKASTSLVFKWTVQQTIIHIRNFRDDKMYEDEAHDQDEIFFDCEEIHCQGKENGNYTNYKQENTDEYPTNKKYKSSLDVVKDFVFDNEGFSDVDKPDEQEPVGEQKIDEKTISNEEEDVDSLISSIQKESVFIESSIMSHPKYPRSPLFIHTYANSTSLSLVSHCVKMDPMMQDHSSFLPPGSVQQPGSSMISHTKSVFCENNNGPSTVSHLHRSYPQDSDGQSSFQTHRVSNDDNPLCSGTSPSQTGLLSSFVNHILPNNEAHLCFVGDHSSFLTYSPQKFESQNSFLSTFRRDQQIDWRKYYTASFLSHFGSQQREMNAETALQSFKKLNEKINPILPVYQIDSSLISHHGLEQESKRELVNLLSFRKHSEEVNPLLHSPLLQPGSFFNLSFQKTPVPSISFLTHFLPHAYTINSEVSRASHEVGAERDNPEFPVLCSHVSYSNIFDQKAKFVSQSFLNHYPIHTYFEDIKVLRTDGNKKSRKENTKQIIAGEMGEKSRIDEINEVVEKSKLLQVTARRINSKSKSRPSSQHLLEEVVRETEVLQEIIQHEETDPEHFLKDVAKQTEILQDIIKQINRNPALSHPTSKRVRNSKKRQPTKHSRKASKQIEISEIEPHTEIILSNQANQKIIDSPCEFQIEKELFCVSRLKHPTANRIKAQKKHAPSRHFFKKDKNNQNEEIEKYYDIFNKETDLEPYETPIIKTERDLVDTHTNIVKTVADDIQEFEQSASNTRKQILSDNPREFKAATGTDCVFTEIFSGNINSVEVVEEVQDVKFSDQVFSLSCKKTQSCLHPDTSSVLSRGGHFVRSTAASKSSENQTTIAVKGEEFLVDEKLFQQTGSKLNDNNVLHDEKKIRNLQNTPSMYLEKTTKNDKEECDLKSDISLVVDTDAHPSLAVGSVSRQATEPEISFKPAAQQCGITLGENCESFEEMGNTNSKEPIKPPRTPRLKNKNRNSKIKVEDTSSKLYPDIHLDGYVFTETVSNEDSKTVTHEFKYYGSKDSVQVAGSFNGWQLEDLYYSEGVWSRQLLLPCGAVQFRFLVDGVWQHDPLYSTVSDCNTGLVNNIIHTGIETAEKGQKAQAPSREKVGRWGKIEIFIQDKETNVPFERSSLNLENQRLSFIADDCEISQPCADSAHSPVQSYDSKVNAELEGLPSEKASPSEFTSTSTLHIDNSKHSDTS